MACAGNGPAAYEAQQNVSRPDPPMFRLLLATLGIAAHLAVVTAPAGAQPSDDPRHGLTRQQDAAALRLARRLVDGNISVQVFTAEHAARLCYGAAAANSPVGPTARDRNGLTASQLTQFRGCVEQSGYRLRG
jgi:hypothetical protein